MRERVIQVEASTPEEASATAARLLQDNPDNIDLRRVGDRQFEASLRNADAEIGIECLANDTEAVIVEYAPPLGKGRPLLPDLLEQELLRNGIQVEAHPEGLKNLRARLALKEDPLGIIIARSRPPTEAQDAYLKPLGNLDLPVFPGSAVAVKIDPIQPEAGMTVRGEDISPKQYFEAEDISPSLPDQCTLSADGQSIIAQGYGLVSIRGNRVEFEPLLAVDEDKLAVRATLFATDFQNEAITPERLQLVLAGRNIQAEIDTVGVQAALDEAEQTSEPVASVVIARGTPPEDGANGRVEMALDLGTRVGTETEDGRIDYRERNSVHTTTAGQVLATVIPPEPGTPGTDVFGAPLPAHDGKPASLRAGDNVTFDENAQTYSAATDGMVVFRDDRLIVSDVFEVDSDIDYHTGNIRMEKGSVLIRGTVRSGFVITAEDNIVIEGAVESAEVIAGGDVEVRGGILMDEQGQVQAGGNVYAHFAQGARIHANGSVHIENDVTNCEILALGKVIATAGRGRIQGGRIRAGEGIEAKQIGCEMGTVSQVILGVPCPEQTELHAERKRVVELMEKIDHAVGTGDPRTILMRTPQPKREAVAKLLKAHIGARDRLREIEVRLDEIAVENRARARSRIKVEGTIFPGTKVTIAGCHLETVHAIDASQLYYSVDDDAIRWIPM